MTNDELMEELRVIRGLLDRLAVVIEGRRAMEELMPVWDCGHRHRSRGEAVACKGKQLLAGRTSDNLKVVEPA